MNRPLVNLKKPCWPSSRVRTDLFSLVKNICIYITVLANEGTQPDQDDSGSTENNSIDVACPRLQAATVPPSLPSPCGHPATALPPPSGEKCKQHKFIQTDAFEEVTFNHEDDIGLFQWRHY
jgi:hypothetical protein